MDITVTMTEPEIIEAIKDFLFKHDVVSQNKEIEVTMVAGRGTNGHSAVIAVKNAVTTITPTVVAAGPIKEDPTLQKAQVPAPEPVINKDVPMPGSTKDTVKEAVKAPGEEITAQATEKLTELFVDEPGQAIPPPVAEPGDVGFDENNISEGTTQPVDSLFQ